VAESFFALSRKDQREALEYGRSETGRPAHLLEKDLWVVWTLRALFDSHLAADLTFKGGTSLSKVYKVIDRFSEDLDLTCDIRTLIPDLLQAEARPENGARRYVIVCRNGLRSMYSLSSRTLWRASA